MDFERCNRRLFLISWLTANVPDIIVALGLLIDVAGVVVLWLKTSTRDIEAEISLGLVEAATPGPREEWVHRISPEEHHRRLENSRRRVRRTRRWVKVGLGLILVGFVLQGIALFVDDWIRYLAFAC